MIAHITSVTLHFTFFADGKCIDCYKGSTPAILVGVVIGAVIGVVIAILLVAALLYLYKAKRLGEYYNIITDPGHTLFNIFL